MEEKDRRRPLAVEVSVSRVERVTPINHTVDGFQDVFDLRDYPLLEVLPQNNKEQTVLLYLSFLKNKNKIKALTYRVLYIFSS